MYCVEDADIGVVLVIEDSDHPLALATLLRMGIEVGAYDTTLRLLAVQLPGKKAAWYDGPTMHTHIREYNDAH